MKLSEYTEKAARTMNPALSRDERLAHCAMGISEEADEFAESVLKVNPNTLEMVLELGDALWYAANMLAELGGNQDFDFPTYDTHVRGNLPLRFNWTSQALQALTLNASAGHAMAEVHHWKYFAHPLDEIKLQGFVMEFVEQITITAISIGATLDAIAERNIAKLQARYPERFSTEASINRVVENE